MGYGHYNKNDQYAGIITRDKSLKKLNLYLWNQSSKDYNKIQTFCSQQKSTCSKNIKNIIPVDWDYNGYLDLIIIADTSDGSSTQSTFTAHFLLQYVQDIQSNECTSTSCELVNVVSSDIDSFTQPFIIPYYNETAHMHGLLYFSKTQDKRVVLISDPKRYDKVVEIEFIQLLQTDLKQCINEEQLEEIQSREFASIHYSSVLDLNGDCRNDLFIHSSYMHPNATVSDSFEFYIRLQNGLYCLTSQYILPAEHKVQAIGFTDINFDGGIDMVIAFNHLDHNVYKSKIQIAYNHITPGSKHLCSDENLFTKIYGDLDNVFETQSDILILEYNFRILEVEENNPYNFPSLRFADFNLDGYNDLLLTVIQPQDTSNSYSYFFENSYCNLPECQKLEQSHKRYFELQDQNTRYGLICSFKSIGASFFDFNENGQLDIILNTYEIDKVSNQKILSVVSIYNYLKTDSYFVKAFVMNGSNDGSANNDFTSSNIYGATVVCQVITIEEQNRPIKGIQLYQSAYIPLQLPYVIMGIARTNSYIENLSVGLGLTGGESVKSWNPIIPNSQINVYPQSNNPENWNVSSFMVNVTESLLAILIIAVCVLFLLGIIIFYLFIKERADDKTENEVANILIN